MKYFSLFFLCLFACNEPSAPANTLTLTIPEASGPVADDERTRLRNAAFCMCAGQSFPDSVKQVINEGSLGGYIELSESGLDAFEAIRELAQAFAKIEYTSKNGYDLTYMKCLDFYNSPQLDSLLNEL